MKKEETQPKGLTIVEFTAENFMKLKAVRIRPEGASMVTLTGKNGAGKSSILNAIMAIVDRAALKKQGVTKLLREGAERGFAKIDLGDIVAKLTLTEKGEYLTVENSEGLGFKSPASVMDKLRGMISFDPLAFAKYDGKKQKEVLLGLVDVGIDLDAHATERETIFFNRTNVGRRRDEFEAKLKGLPTLPADLPEEEIPLTTVSDERKVLEKAHEANGEKRRTRQLLADEYRTLASDRETSSKDWEAAGKRIKELEEEIALLKEKQKSLVELDASLAKKMETTAAAGVIAKNAVDNIVEADFTVLDTRLEEIGRTNENVREKKRRAEIRSSFEKEAAEYTRMTDAIKALDKKKDDALAAAKFPIEGLGFDADGITFNKLPLGSASDGEKLTVSVAIGMALNPELRVLWFNHGEMLDSDHWAIIEKLAGDQEYQVWAEKMDESGKVGIFISEGEVGAIDGEEVQREAAAK